MGNKTMEEQFREQAELIDRRFDESFRSQAELIDRRLDASFRSQAELIDRRFDESFRSQAELIDRLFLARDQKWDVRFERMEKDITIVREGIGILLKRRG